jgi:hypothetical protein
MSDIDPHLIDAALREIQAVANETAVELTPEEVVPIVLGMFTITDEWQSLSCDVVAGHYEDAKSKVYGSVEDLLNGLGTDALDPHRWLHHRFVLSTDWQQVKPDLEWKPA